MLEAADKSYDSVFWRDNEGAKMFLSLDKNQGVETSDSLIQDLEQVASNKDQDILTVADNFPSTLIVETQTENVEDAKDIIRQFIADRNSLNPENQQVKIDKIEESVLSNNSKGLTISIITQQDLGTQNQREDEDDQPDVIIIQRRDAVQEEQTDQERNREDEDDQLDAVPPQGQQNIAQGNQIIVENGPPNRPPPIRPARLLKSENQLPLVQDFIKSMGKAPKEKDKASKHYKNIIKTLNEYNNEEERLKINLKKQTDELDLTPEQFNQANEELQAKKRALESALDDYLLNSKSLGITKRQ